MADRGTRTVMILRMKDRTRNDGGGKAAKHALLWSFLLLCLTAAGLTVGGMDARAQLAPLYGSRILLSNGTNAITLKDSSVMHGLNYTLTLPAAQATASTTEWLQIGSSSSTLSWQTNAAGLNGSAIAFGSNAPQQYAPSTDYLFDLQSLAPTGANGGANAVNAPAPGSAINSTVTGTSDNATGLTVNVANTLASATGVTELGANFFGKAYTTNNGSSSVNVGLSASASGHGTNYPALFTNGSVGIGTTNPLQLLDVNGNIRISGINGLRITEGSNATMGIATLASGTVTVSTTKVTASSRIFLMDQAASGTPGTAYVNSRTAGTSFVINSTSGSDNSSVAWWIVEPGLDRVYTTSTTLTVPTGITRILVNGVGGAGGGGGGGAKTGITATGGAGGGGAGGSAEFIPNTPLTVVPGETLTITIGPAGTAGIGGTAAGASGTSGGNGGSTTIVGSSSGTIFTANGGIGGTFSANRTGGSGNAGGTGGAGGSSVSTPSGTSGNTGATGASSGTAVTASASGGTGSGNPNTGGSGGTGFGTNTIIVTGAGGAGTAGTSGYVEIAY
jgi:hypothetical protein